MQSFLARFINHRTEITLTGAICWNWLEELSLVVSSIFNQHMAALVTHIMSVPALLGNSQDVSPVNGAGARDCKIKVIFAIFYINICFTILSE